MPKEIIGCEGSRKGQYDLFAVGLIPLKFGSFIGDNPLYGRPAVNV